VERFVKNNPDANASVMDIEELVRLGDQRGVCPYYLSRELASTADLVFMPYNYLIDPRNRLVFISVSYFILAWIGALL
jgi:regulator of telomere elongation helicase 1